MINDQLNQQPNPYVSRILHQVRSLAQKKRAG